MTLQANRDITQFSRRTPRNSDYIPHWYASITSRPDIFVLVLARAIGLQQSRCGNSTADPP